MTVALLRRPNGDPACADLLHQLRAANERHIELALDAISKTPIGHPDRPLWETEHNVLQALAAKLRAVAPPRTRIAETAS